MFFVVPLIQLYKQSRIFWFVSYWILYEVSLIYLFLDALSISSSLCKREEHSSLLWWTVSDLKIKEHKFVFLQFYQKLNPGEKFIKPTSTNIKQKSIKNNFRKNRLKVLTQTSYPINSSWIIWLTIPTF